ncbi:MAG: hypothetical protein U9N39_08915, partial [Campylobacterota bacterium]|nr:hypothetical protein [Campylobacterota bacterium]
MKTKQIEDIVENEKDVFEISDIEKIFTDKDVLNEYETKYPNDLYMIIFSSLTHEQCESEEKAKDVVQGIASHHKELNTI